MATTAISLRRPRRLKFNKPGWWTLFWFVAGFALNLSQTWLYQNLWVMVLAIIGFHFAWGLGQSALFVLMLFDGRRDVRIWLPVMALGLAFFFVTAQGLSRWGDQTAFGFMKPAYDRVIADAATGKLPPPAKGQDIAAATRDGVSYSYSPSKPDLIAFKWLDGPEGGAVILHDGSDAVKNMAFDGPVIGLKAALDSIVTQHIVKCDPFSKPHYYFCSFG
ncbi:MAG TPA: hypothetical protein VG942_00215 [Hyphomonadaceae bacterium]|nr:hypothetical protein [Hyphomonadaceae bacterium]